MFRERSEFYYTPEENYARADSFILKSLNEGRITEEDKRFIDEFICEKDSEGISAVRHYKIVTMIIGNRKYHPPFSQCTISDVQGVIKKIKEDKLEDGTPRYKHNTIADRIRELKRFFIWLQENGYSDIDLKKLEKIRPPAYVNTVNEKDILTKEEIESFLNCCPSNRDRALFWMLYEGAFRVSEIGQLKFKDVKITEKFLRVTTDGKTGKIRYIPLILSRQHYVKWVNEYPNPITPDSYVFLDQYGKQISRAAIAKQMKIIGKKAGIEKKLHPHLFRHSRITHLLQGDYPMPESHLKLLAWGSVSTNMLSTYQHLTSTDIEHSLAKVNGLEIEEEESPSKKHRVMMKPIVCKNCGTINSPGTSLCEECGTPLNEAGHDMIEAFKIFISNYAMNNPGVIYETNVGSKLKEAANIFDQEKQPSKNG